MFLQGRTTNYKAKAECMAKPVMVSKGISTKPPTTSISVQTLSGPDMQARIQNLQEKLGTVNRKIRDNFIVYIF